MREISVDDLCIILEDHEKRLYTDPREVHADLRGANLSKANLSGADPREVSGLNIEQLSKVETLYNTKLEPELMEQVKEKYSHLLKKPKEAESKPGE
jgi:hypothetical protein